ncbi:MAG TPA: hypothetical protein VJA26_06555, partial [Gammaproteobacteria bacterium]|nr:hypothetical protein [Gammaproteobacteria bacterium]
HRRVGRNLLLFQAIEQSLRFMLPYVHPDGSASGAEAMRQYQRHNIERKSLGPLLEQFRGSVSGTPDLLETGLNGLLAARNELVHHFYANERVDFLSPSGGAAALAYLEEQYKYAQEWAEIFPAQSLVLLLILTETNPELAAEYGQHRERLIAQLPASLEIVDPELRVQLRNLE